MANLVDRIRSESPSPFVNACFAPARRILGEAIGFVDGRPISFSMTPARGWRTDAAAAILTPLGLIADMFSRKTAAVSIDRRQITPATSVVVAELEDAVPDFAKISRILRSIEFISPDDFASLKSAWPRAMSIALRTGNASFPRAVVASSGVLVRGDRGETPLHVAVGCDAKEFAQALLKQGADPNALDHQGATPLHIAASNKSPKSAELLSAVADVQALDASGATPLHKAVLSGALEVISSLLKKKEIDLNYANEENMAPLHVAIITRYQRDDLSIDYERNYQIARPLVEAGADVDVADRFGKRGDRALHMAVWEKQYLIVLLLTRFGARADLANKKGESPLDLLILQLRKGVTEEESILVIRAALYLLMAGGDITALARYTEEFSKAKSPASETAKEEYRKQSLQIVEDVLTLWEYLIRKPQMKRFRMKFSALDHSERLKLFKEFDLQIDALEFSNAEQGGVRQKIRWVANQLRFAEKKICRDMREVVTYYECEEDSQLPFSDHDSPSPTPPRTPVYSSGSPIDMVPQTSDIGDDPFQNSSTV